MLNRHLHRRCRRQRNLTCGVPKMIIRFYSCKLNTATSGPKSAKFSVEGEHQHPSVSASGIYSVNRLASHLWPPQLLGHGSVALSPHQRLQLETTREGAPLACLPSDLDRPHPRRQKQQLLRPSQMPSRVRTMNVSQSN